MGPLKGQLSLRGIIIGAIGCVIITATSAYIALKMGALPWPIIFAAIISLVVLKALGNTNLNEVNVTHTVMSAGAMVAGGLAFTIPGIWIIGAGEVETWHMLLIAFAGVVLGLAASALLRKHFIESEQLEFPIGVAAAETIKAGNTGGRTGIKLTISMAFAGIYTALRDWFGTVPALFLNSVNIPGVAFGIYNSPMLLAVGFIVGTSAVVVWFLGALLGNFGIIAGGSGLGFWSVEAGQGIAASLGMGVMMGCGIGVILKNIIPQLVSGLFKRRDKSSNGKGNSLVAAQVGTKNCTKKGTQNTPGSPQGTREDTQNSAQTSPAQTSFLKRYSAGVIACFAAALALVLCFALGLAPLACIIVVLFAWITAAMSAQSVGQTGIDPMEIFGLIVLLVVAAVSDTPQIQLFFVAAIIAVACGLAGDLMNDYKAGHVLGTNPQAQWFGQAVGSIIGAVVAVLVMTALVAAYGTSAFGPSGTFIAAQASVVATMVAGVPSLPAFVVGIVAGCLLYFTGLPVMMLGLGIYLPFYMSFTAFLGAMAKLVFDAINRLRQRNLAPAVKEEQAAKSKETGLIVASGLLGGESVAGIIIAFIVVGMSLG